MSTTWFAKIDCNFHDNPKAIEAGLLGRAVYVLVLCINAQKGAIGIISEGDLRLWYVARELQVSEAEAKAGIDAAIRADLIRLDDGMIIICGWSDDYARSPLKSADKQKAYRERVKQRKAAHTTVTGVTDHGNALLQPETALPAVTQVGRKEGREVTAVTPAPIAQISAPAVPLATRVWNRVSELRIALAAELGKGEVLPLTPITPASANQRGYSDLRERLREEGTNAEMVSARILEALVVQARTERTIDWLSERTFTPGGWVFARESIPKWIKVPPRIEPEEPREWVDELGEVSA